jgi:fructose-1,6-bisphosphatase/inositol monophosphatase family enzyme
MSLNDPHLIVPRLVQFQAHVRDLIVKSHEQRGLMEVDRTTAADTIYKIDAVVDPVLEAFCEEWSRTTPLVLVAEGLEDEHGAEGRKVFPTGTREADALIRVIVDPIDGTRGIMYDKRPAWSLAGVAPNKGPDTRLRDIEVAVMTELPTSKMGSADVLWAIKGQGAKGQRVDLRTGEARPLPIQPSSADNLAHGFAMISNFFPGTKILASELMERVVSAMLGDAEVSKALVFEDQYISTGGQFYELIVGHDRFNADLRSLFYRVTPRPLGLCVHPYDLATLLIAEEAGVVVTDGLGNPLDGPLDHTTGLSWAGYANETLRRKIEPILRSFFTDKGIA